MSPLETVNHSPDFVLDPTEQASILVAAMDGDIENAWVHALRARMNDFEAMKEYWTEVADAIAAMQHRRAVC